MGREGMMGTSSSLARRNSELSAGHREGQQPGTLPGQAAKGTGQRPRQQK